MQADVVLLDPHPADEGLPLRVERAAFDGKLIWTKMSMSMQSCSCHHTPGDTRQTAAVILRARIAILRLLLWEQALRAIVQ